MFRYAARKSTGPLDSPPSHLPFQLELTDSYGQFNILHMNQDGVIG